MLKLAMATATALRSLDDIESFMVEYYAAWGGTDEDRIMSYYAENVTIQIPGSLMQGHSVVREQFVRPFITAFAGNRHFVKNIIFERDVAAIEFTFKADIRVRSRVMRQPTPKLSCPVVEFTSTIQRGGRSHRRTFTSMSERC